MRRAAGQRRSRRSTLLPRPGSTRWRRLRGHGAEACLRADRPRRGRRAVGEAVARFGGLDGLVSNAGVNRPGPLADYAVADWDHLFAVNTRATWLLAKAAHPALRASGGAIVAIGSMSGSNAHANLGAYGPSKAAVIMLVQVLAQEFGRDGIRVNAVSPGMVRTGMTARVYEDARIAAERDSLVPLGRVATPEDMADVSRSARLYDATSAATAT
jgi:glucose 1-dehydrogenase